LADDCGQDVWAWQVRFLTGNAECMQRTRHVSQWADLVNRGGGYPGTQGLPLRRREVSTLNAEDAGMQDIQQDS
jgi:hypothetical protein